MADRLSDPIGRLMGLRYKSHPWHGVFIGKDAPENVTAFIEVVPTDTVKYEIDKENGTFALTVLKNIRTWFLPYMDLFPRLTVASRLEDSVWKKQEKPESGETATQLIFACLPKKLLHTAIFWLMPAQLAGFRMIDGNEADDKIIAVLTNDVVYSEYKDLSDLPDIVVERLKHYFLTYKDMPGKASHTEITHIYGVSEALEVIKCSISDYHQRFDNIGKLL